MLTCIGQICIQLGQLSVIPPGLVLEAGGTSTLQAAMPVKLKSPPTSRFQVGGTSALQAWLPAKLKSPPLQAQVRGGSRWADLAVSSSTMNLQRRYFVFKRCRYLVFSWVGNSRLSVKVKAIQ